MATATRTGRWIVIGCTVLHLIVGIAFRRSGRYLKELSTQHELVGAVAVGEQAVVANAMEAVGEHMEQDPTHELARIKPHDLVFVVAVLATITNPHFPSGTAVGGGGGLASGGQGGGGFGVGGGGSGGRKK